MFLYFNLQLFFNVEECYTMSKLAKTLSFMDIYLFSIGYIIGAGIFILVGKVGKSAKDKSWISFLLAGICGILISSTYIDISFLETSNFGEMTIIQETFGSISSIIYTLLIIGIGIFTNSTVSLSIGEAAQDFIPLSATIISILFIGFFTFINCLGIRESAYYNHFSTIIEVVALLCIIVVGFQYPHKKVSGNTSISYSNIIYTSMLAMFAYSGFEATVKLTEEAKDPMDIPKAIVASILTATILYILVSVVALKCMSPKELGESSFPLMDISKILMGSSVSKLFLLIGIISISNTLLISILGTSRVIHSIGRDDPLLAWLSNIDEERKTPIIATIVVGICSILGLYIKNTEKLAGITTCLLFLVFALLNAALFKMYLRDENKEKLKQSWTHPINQAYPILPACSLLITLDTLMYGCYHNVIR